MLVPEINHPQFIRSAYDLSSCGIGVQTLVVKLLTEQSDSPQLKDRDIFGASSNLLLDICKAGDHLGEAGDSLRARVQKLGDEWAGLRRKAARALFSMNEERGFEPFQKEEFAQVMGKLFEGEALEEDQLHGLHEEFSCEFTFGGRLMRMGLPIERCRSFVDGLREVLRSGACAEDFVAYHLRKLALMTEIFEADVDPSVA
ncbi:hypothetical protein MRY87_13690 [bacterium]|nr:hypothetical protein [bacterium]